ncbi:hypothetical protein [Leeia aquatica]|uniref:Uncharacterized protein n=1 Tax=Leeia aquatica TaxID=2725557 RepID=A0A847RQP9_9NEIS|nr:hypothetical protein [Leeia aquatica]NLR73560.1 hypothetical protein [Leeia aquatica]
MRRKLLFMSILIVGCAYASSPAEVEHYVKDLDTAIKASTAVLKKSDLASLRQHSTKMNELKKAGEKYGTTAFDLPYGRCFSSGVMAQEWWSAQLTAAQNGGVERTPGRIDSAWKQYQSNRAECLKAAHSGGKAPGTVVIASASETPPRKGCLKVLGVRPDGTVGTTAYTCPKQ